MATDPLLLTSTPRTSQEYWFQSRYPLSCLAFLLPLLVTYELGVLLLGGDRADALRNGADFWLRDLLQRVGLHQPYLLPVLVVGLLLAWHIIGKYPRRVSLETLLGMLAESVLFGFCLIVIAQLEDMAFRQWAVPASMAPHAVALSPLQRQVAAQVVAFLGAGIYEEVLFRLLLLPACFVVLRLLLVPRNWAAVFAVLGTSLLFSAAHYMGSTGEAFVWSTFVFRTLAGLFFALLFVFRGFGITVGSHAAYDLLVGVLLVGHG
ncbi:MAG TPA: CPBP family intramembrane metalloprotease [Planctomycetaceae bacterium]|nr:CPBP family intramembrane metalloprotease [Planctomycetaceae bacterium]